MWLWSLCIVCVAGRLFLGATVIAIVYAVNIESRMTPWMRDKLTPGKLRTSPQLVECDTRVFPELGVMKVSDHALQDI